MKTKPPAPAKEIRAVKGMEVRAASADKPGVIGTLTGYAATFGTDSQVMSSREHPRPFVERIAPGAFSRSLKDDGSIFMLWQHNEDTPLARSGSNLTLAEDARGLAFTADIPDTSTGRDLLANVRAGVIDANSFSFSVREGGEVWTKEEGRDIRTLTDVRLFEISPVVFPAYPDTTLAARAHSRFMQVCAEKPETRSYVMSAEDYLCCDPTLTPDAAFACEMLDQEFAELDAAQTYLRVNPSGALADYANATATDSAADIATLTAWIAANGATVNPDYAARMDAIATLNAQRSAPAKSSENATAAPLIAEWRRKIFALNR